MNFSFRYFTALVIFIGLWALVVQQVLLDNSQSWSEKILHTINPFWNTTAVQQSDIFSHQFHIEITNNSHENQQISGKIFLSQANGTPIQNIGIIDENTNPPGILVDYLPINPDKQSIPAGETKIFTTEWKWIGDKFIHEKKPIISFESPILDLQNPEDFNISFYQKLVQEEKKIPLLVKKEIIFSETETQTSEENIEISYYIFKKTTNTGLLFIIGIILIFILILSKHTRKTEENPQEIALKAISEFEQWAHEVIKNLPNKKKKFKKITNKKSNTK